MAFAISTAVALGAAAIGAGGAIIASGNSRSASDHAAQAATDAASQNNATQTAIYGSNKANLAPYTARGNTAGDAYNALLGLGGATQAPSSGQLTPQYGGGGGYGANAFGGDYMNGGYAGRAMDGNASQPYYGSPAAYAPQAAQATPSASTQAMNAFNTFTNSDGYKFRVGQGIGAIDTGAASRGALDSGAAVKAEQTYGQNIASDEFGKYMGYLGNQQSVGLASANALAGVGTNYANAISSNNNNAAGAVGSAAIQGANATNAGIKGLTNAFGQFAGNNSSYGGGGGYNPPAYQNTNTGMDPTYDAAPYAAFGG